MAATPQLTFASVEPLAGPAIEVRERLKGVDDGQIVAFLLEHAGKNTAIEFAETMRLIAPIIIRKLVDRETAALEKLIDALLPAVALPEHLFVEARMNAEARKVVLQSAEWINATQLSEMAGFVSRNASAQPNKWKRDGRIFAIRHQGADLFPDYALDANRQFRPVQELAPVLSTFGEQLDGWDIAIWFASVNSFLGGVRPKDVLTSAPERVIKAAQDEIGGVVHG